MKKAQWYTYFCTLVDISFRQFCELVIQESILYYNQYGAHLHIQGRLAPPPLHAEIFFHTHLTSPCWLRCNQTGYKRNTAFAETAGPGAPLPLMSTPSREEYIHESLCSNRTSFIMRAARKVRDGDGGQVRRFSSIQIQQIELTLARNPSWTLVAGPSTAEVFTNVPWCQDKKPDYCHE